MNILITGGAGFQGTHLAQKMLGLGHAVTVLNTLTPQASGNEQYLEGCRVLWGSITDAEVTEKAMRGKDVVFHLGARVNVDESIAHPWETMEVNVRGTYNVLEAVKKTGTRMILTSSCEVYGLPERAPVAENAELRPMSPYAASKAAADRLCFAYAQTYKTPVTIARFFNIFGERQKEGTFGAVIPIFVGRALAGKPITVFGTGEQTRDYVYISDVVRAYEMLLDHPELRGEVVNFGSGHATRIKDIAEYVAKKLNGKVIYADGRPGEASNMIADSSKAKRLLGWESAVNIYEGIDRYIAWRGKK
ncbi:MAG: GDP-mannose 4,6-dehydratase [bacterium]|nr:GDP-mannose 4,6-dehydratase [bacterium]